MKKNIDKYKKWNPSPYATALLLLTPFLIYVIRNFILDNDFWFLVNTGKTILKEGFIHIEPFTIHEGLAFIPQQWLTDIVFYLIYDNLGIRGMFYFVIVCNCLLLFVFYKTAFLVSNNRKKSLIITVVVDIVIIGMYVLTTRPQMFDLLFFSFEIYILELFVTKNKDKYLYFLLLESLLLINFHASMWMMFFVLLLPYYAEYIYMRLRKRDAFKIKKLLIVTVLSFLIGFINPYGKESILYLFNSYGVDIINSVVFEMQAVSIDEFIGIIFFAIILLIFYSFYYNKGNNKCRYLLLTLGTVYLGLSHYRGIMFVLIIAPLVLAYNFKSNANYTDIKVSLYEKIIYIFLIIISAVFICSKPELSSEEYLKDIVDYLDNNASHDIKLYTSYNDGGYLEYRGYKCYIDARAEVFLKTNNRKEDIFKEYAEISVENVNDFVVKYDFDYLLVDSNARILLYELENNKQYEKVYSIVTNERDGITHYLFKKVIN